MKPCPATSTAAIPSPVATRERISSAISRGLLRSGRASFSATVEA